MRLKDKVAIVTGGGTGIGKAIVRLFASEGAKMVLASRTFSRLEEVVGEIKAAGGEAIAIPVDITNEEQVKQMVDRTLKEYNRIDILVNNSAAGSVFCNLVDMNVNDWVNELNTNLVGTMLCTREVLKAMIPRKSGSIIHVSSIAGIYGVPGRSAYSASKWGVIGFMEAIAIEAGEYSIRVNSISPAATKTDRFERVQRNIAEARSISYEEAIGGMLGHYALKRIAEPSETAAAALFLASDDSSAITGHNLVVSCGFHPVHP
jgi:NAD(P)-dependent dehydrogenase (short-subunit alcohol dehydrogenase family)